MSPSCLLHHSTDKRQDQLSRAHAISSHPKPALLWCPGDVQFPLSRMLQQVRGRIISSSPDSAFPFAVGGKEQGQKNMSPPPPLLLLHTRLVAGPALPQLLQYPVLSLSLSPCCCPAFMFSCLQGHFSHDAQLKAEGWGQFCTAFRHHVPRQQPRPGCLPGLWWQLSATTTGPQTQMVALR